MAFIEHNHMVEQITAARADETFGHAILPRALDAGSFGLYPEAPDRLSNAVIKVRATVEDQVAGRGIIGKRFAQLLRYPCAGWMPRDVEMQNLTPAMGDNEEAVEHAKSQRWHREEVHRGDSFAMVRQECQPIFLPAQDSGALSASSSAQFVQRFRSRASSVRHECAARPRWGSPRPCGRSTPAVPCLWVFAPRSSCAEKSTSSTA